MSKLFRKTAVLLIMTLLGHFGARAQEISSVYGNFRMDFSVYDSQNRLCELINIVQITEPEYPLYNRLNIPASVNYNGNEYSVARIGNRTVFQGTTASGISFRDNPKLLTGIDLSNFFASCPYLQEVVGLEDITEIAPYMFYDCPEMRPNTQMFPSSVTKIGEYAFAMSTEPGKEPGAGAIIGPNIKEVASNAYSNRIMIEGAIPFSPDTLRITGPDYDRPYPFVAQNHTIYRNIDCTGSNGGNADIMQGIRSSNTNFAPLCSSNHALEIFFLSNSHVGELSFGECPKLRQLVVQNSSADELSYSYSADNDSTLKVCVIQGSEIGDMALGNIAGSKMQAFIIQDCKVRDLKLSEVPPFQGINTLSVEKLAISNWLSDTLDISGVNCFGEDQRVSLQAGMGGKGVRTLIFPDNLHGTVYYNNWPSLEDVYIGKYITGIGEFNDYSHEIVYAGDMSDWCKLVIDGGQKSSWSEFYYSWPDSPMHYVTKLWYGDGRNKTRFVEDLVLTDIEKIPSYAFAGYCGLKSVKISGNTYIDECAFSSCRNLKSIDIDGCAVGKGAFGHSFYVEQITIGANTKSFEPYCFSRTGFNAKTPTRVDYKGKPSQWASIDFKAVDVDYFEGRPYTFSAGINPAWIAKGGFYIQDKIVETLEFDEMIERVAAYAFSNMSSLKEVRFKDKAPSNFGDDCFSNCSSLCRVIFYVAPRSRAAESPAEGITIGKNAFYNDAMLSEISFLDDVEDIGASAFEGTPLIENQANGPVYIGSTLYEYKGSAPANTVLEVKEGTSVLCANSLRGQSGITGIVLPKSLLKVYEGALSGTGLEGSLTVPDKVSVFASNIESEKLTKVVFEDSDTPLYKTAKASGIEELYMGRNFVPTYHYYTDADGEQRLSSVTGNDIATGANLKVVTFGPKVTEIPLYTFPTQMWDLTTLRSLNPEPPLLPAMKFDDFDREWTMIDRVNPETVVLEVPQGSLEKYRNAEGWKEFLNIRETSGIGNITTESGSAEVKGYYNTLGVFSTRPFEGLNIEVRGDGSKRKVFHKL